MKNKLHKKTLKRIRRAANKWISLLGLAWWSDIVFLYCTDRTDFQDGNTETIFRVWARWEYLSASIMVNMHKVSEMTDDELERALVHELVHILLTEITTDTGEKHVERTTTQLTQVLFWVRTAALNGDLK